MIYDHKAIEAKWADKWLKYKIYEPDLNQAKKPFYNLMMFPYPSAEGLHVGNMYAFTGADVHGRFQRMQGLDVFEPIGLDGFGIHSENYAIKIKEHPVDQAKVSEKRFYDQLSRIGAGYAWESRLETYDPAYYRWTQWLFIQMFKRGLAYRGTARVNWCPSCKTVLADEQVEGGVCERCKTPVVRREMKQWFFGISKYADRLLANIEKIDWPDKIKIAQRQWIGKKEGINITYEIIDSDQTLTCFTTTPVNWGATFIVIAPEHPFLKNAKIPSNYRDAVDGYLKNSLVKTEQQRKEAEREKSGVFTGVYAKNHVTGKKMPIWVSDFVLMDVGTGAVQGCPGHDTRDFEFALKYGIEIPRVVVDPNGDSSPIDSVEKVIVSGMPGKMINSGFLNGMEFVEAMQKTMDFFEEKGWGKRVYNYHLRDWLISRQRYWGPPIPMIYCQHCVKNGRSWFTKSSHSELGSESKKTLKQVQGDALDWNHYGWYPVPEAQLPVKLPFVKDYQPIGEGKSPLEKAPESWKRVACPECGQPARRETDVSDTFLDSSWYFLAYPNLKTKDWKSGPTPFDRELTSRWLPVTAYIGGAEHAVLHLLYSRFVWMALQDWGYLDKKLDDEPFPFLFSHGLIIKDGAKMSKSRGNVVIPDDYIDRHGADTLRLYLMFLGSYSQGGDFRDTGIAGMSRFVKRIWNLFQDPKKIGATTTPALKIKLHQTINRMAIDLGHFRYNTAIAAFMEFTNAWKERQTFKEGIVSKEDAQTLVKLIAPLTPHLAEELWQRFNQEPGFKSVHLEPYPVPDAKFLVSKKVTVVIQINGKTRALLTVDAERTGEKDFIIETAKIDQKVKKWLKSKQINKEIFVAPSGQRQGIINFVVN